jgi:uncharacterized membrane protein YjdF
MTIYEVNKASYAKLPVLDKEGLDYAVKLLSNYITKSENQYYMILNHDIHYYTIYNWKDCLIKQLAKDVLALMSSLGSLKAVELSKDGSMVEFWIIDITGECNMYAFFGYDKGVIEI